MFASLMASTAHDHRRPASRRRSTSAITGAKEDSTDVSLWIWLAGTALLTLPAIGNFFQIGL